MSNWWLIVLATPICVSQSLGIKGGMSRQTPKITVNKIFINCYLKKAMMPSFSVERIITGSQIIFF